MLNNNAAVMPRPYIVYVVTTDSRTGRPTTCTMEARTTTVNPSTLVDWSEQLSRSHRRSVEHYFTMADALNAVQFITELAAENAANTEHAGRFPSEAAAVRYGKEYAASVTV